MVRTAIILSLSLSLSLGACKDDKDLDDIPAPSQEQIDKARKKASDRKKAASKDGASAKKKSAADMSTAGGDKSTIEKRREKQKKRLEELKKRNEKRRKERLEKLRKNRDAAKNTKKPAPPSEAPAAAAKEKRKPSAKPPAATKKPPAAVPTKKPQTAVAKPPKRPEKAPPRPRSAVATAGAPTTPINALDISRFINLIEIREITGKPDIRANGALVGIPLSTRYNSALFVRGKQDFAASIQVWRDVSRRKGNERFQAMRASYPDAQDTDAVSTKGFFSAFGNLMTLVFFEPFKRTLIAVTCSSDVCSQQSLLKLAQRAKTQM